MKNKRYFIGIITIILVVVVSMLAGCKKGISEQELHQKVTELNDTIHIDWGQIRPLTVTNNITITSGEKELIRYDKKYIILEDNTGYLQSKTVFLAEESSDLNNQQEVYYCQNQLAVKYTDKDGESVKKFDSPYSSFQEMISGGANDIFSYNYNYEYFADVQYQELEDYTSITFTLQDSHLNDFLGEEVNAITNFNIKFKLYYNISKIEVELEYDTAEGGTDAHVKAVCIAEQIGNIEIPEWA